MKVFRLPRWRLSPLLGALLAAGIGLACLLSDVGKPLERFSYDLPFVFRSNVATRDIAIVYLDEASARALGQPVDVPWDRKIFAQLLDRLHATGAKLVCFDLVFSTASADPTADEEFARAMMKHGGVILGGGYSEHEQFGTHVSSVEKPTPVLRMAQADWGLLVFRPIDPDGAVRELCLRYQGIPTIGLAAASRARGIPAPPDEELPIRWLNYYGPAGEAFESVSIADALRDEGVPPGFFQERTVFIGGRYSAGTLRTAKDEFGNPYSRWGRGFSPGVEIHATTFLNLLQQDWLRRLPSSSELAILVAFGLFVGASLCLLRPQWALIATVGCGMLIFAGCCGLAWRHLIWFPWAIPVAAQLPIALGWSVGAQYFYEHRRRAALRRAFAYYLSPEMADRIADSNFDLRPGGIAVEATIVFTDLENFTALSESLEVEDVSKVLIAYFTETTKHILKNKGTIIKYLGDAVLATWNAPLTDPDHAQHAIRAAWSLAEASKHQIGGYTLRTRVGIHTGQALAGNLGSPFRFDYTVIGDAPNLASRMQEMNKHLGTQILLSEATKNLLNDDFITRCLGKFLVKGKTVPVILFELLGPKTREWEVSQSVRGWFSCFGNGLDAFASGDLKNAALLMTQTIQLRGGKDGPAEFYLRQIAAAQATGVNDGLVRMQEK